MNDAAHGRLAADGWVWLSLDDMPAQFIPYLLVDGGAGDDQLLGTDGDDTLNGKDGHDELRGGPGNDLLDGGAGDDAVLYADAPAGVEVDLASGTARGGGGDDKLVSIEQAWGSIFDDRLTGNDADNSLYGGPGADRLTGGDGNDWLNGGSGNDMIAGGLGFDYADFSRALGGVQVDLARTRASGADGDDTLTSIEGIWGSHFSDTLTGSELGNVFAGYGGNDTIDGGGWEDWALYATPIDEAEIRHDPATGWLTITTAHEGTDRLHDVEVVFFANKRFDVSQFTVRSAPTPVHFGLQGALDVGVAQPLVLSFNEPISAGSGLIVLRDGSGAVAAAFDAATSPAIRVDGNQLHIAPLLPLQRDTAYTIELPAGAVRDLDGTANVANADFGFRTRSDVEVLLPRSVRIDEGAGVLRVELTLSGPSTWPIEVTLGFESNTAVPGIDLSADARTLNFMPGQTALTVELPLLDDDRFEPDEVLTLTLSNPVGAALGRSTAPVTIVDDDAAPVVLPTDPLLRRQWHLYEDGGINVMPVWGDYDGRGVRVGVFDSGIDAAHEDLSPNLDRSQGRTLDDLSPGGDPIDDSDNHGTAVAGVIGAARNGRGGVGVAPGATLVSLYQGDSLRQAIPNAFDYARGLDVLNDSWGFGPRFHYDQSWAFYDNFETDRFAAAADSLRRLAQEGRGGLGTVVVQSAGNGAAYGDDTNLHNLQNSRYVITVGATDYFGRATDYTTPGASVLVAAPGGMGHGDDASDILTTDRSGRAGYEDGDDVAMAGTSFSAPVVSGIVALMLQANPQLGYRDVQAILASSARITDASDNAWRYNSAAGWNGGGLHYDAQDHELGFGLVDAHAAVRLAETWQQTPATAANAVQVRVDRPQPVAIPDDGSVLRQAVDIAEALIVERVEVRIDARHAAIEELELTLVSPTGTESRLLTGMPQNDALVFDMPFTELQFSFGSVLHLGESSLGTWSIRLLDKATGHVGTLQSWSLTLIGRADGADDLLVYTDEFGESAAAQPARATLADAGGIDTLNAAAISSDSRIDLVAGSQSLLDGHALSIAAGTDIEHAVAGDGDDALLGNALANTLRGMRGNDALTGRGGDDRLDGGAGIDTARYSGLRGAYVLTHEASGHWQVAHGTNGAGADGRDELVAIERLAFGDVSLALDTARDGHAGETAQILRALFGSEGLANRVYAGIGLKLLDDGIGYADLVAAAIATDTFAQLAGSRSNADFVRLVYRNVVGVDASAAELASYVGLLDSGAYTQAQLATVAAQAGINANSVALAGLADTGLPYLPYGG